MKGLFEYLNESIFDDRTEEVLIAREMLYPEILAETRALNMRADTPDKDASDAFIKGCIKSLNPLEFRPNSAFDSISIDPSVSGALDFRFGGKTLHYRPTNGKFTCHCLNSVPNLCIQIFRGKTYIDASNIKVIENLNETVSEEVEFASGDCQYKNCEIKIDKKSKSIDVILNGISSWDVFDGLKIVGPDKYIKLNFVHQGLQSQVFKSVKMLDKLWKQNNKTKYYQEEKKFLEPILKYFPLTRYIYSFGLYEIFEENGEFHIKME